MGGISEFSVEPGNLDGYAGLVGRAADNTRFAMTYLSANAKVDNSCPGELWQKVLGEHEPVVEKAGEILRSFGRILNSSAAELKKSARYYRETDQKEAAKLDATYPSGLGLPAYDDGYSGGVHDFRDGVDAAALLRAPGGSDGYIQGHIDEFKFNPGLKTFGTMLDLVSPSALVAEGIKLAFGFDVTILGNFVPLFRRMYQTGILSSMQHGMVTQLTRLTIISAESPRSSLMRKTPSTRCATAM